MEFLLALKINKKEEKIYPKYLIKKKDFDFQAKRELNTNALGSINFYVDNQKYTAWFDKSYKARFKDEIVPTLALNKFNKDIILFGNLLFAKIDKQGYVQGLDEEEIETIRKFIVNNHKNVLKDSLSRVETLERNV